MPAKQGRIMWVCPLGHLPHGICKHKATIRGLEGSSRKGTKVHRASGTRSVGHRQQDRDLLKSILYWDTPPTPLHSSPSVCLAQETSDTSWHKGFFLLKRLFIYLLKHWSITVPDASENSLKINRIEIWVLTHAYMPLPLRRTCDVGTIDSIPISQMRKHRFSYWKTCPRGQLGSGRGKILARSTMTSKLNYCAKYQSQCSNRWTMSAMLYFEDSGKGILIWSCMNREEGIREAFLEWKQPSQANSATI